MQRILRHFIIQLLVAAIVGLGIAQAGVELCPPACSHCGVVTVASPCCDDMIGDGSAASTPVKTGHRPDCDHGIYCDAIDAKNYAIPVNRSVDKDLASIEPAAATVVVSVPAFPVRYPSFSLKSPPPGKQPAIYISHCSLLI